MGDDGISDACTTSQVKVRPVPFEREGIPLPTIFQVPKYIRQSDEVAYTPQVISIGPYHWRKVQNEEDDIVSSLREFKQECLRFLLHISGEDKWAMCLEKLKHLSGGIKMKYSTKNNATRTDDEVANMMLLDGCFVIRMLLTSYKFRCTYQNVDARQVSPSNGVGRCLPIGPIKGFCSDSYHSKSEKVEGSKRSDSGASLSYEERAPNSNLRASLSPRAIIKIDEEIPGSLLGKAFIRKLVLYDLLKLENQMPFCVIEDLLEVFGLKFERPLEEVVVSIFSEIQTIKYSIPSGPPSTGYNHILHLFYLSLLPPTSTRNSDRCNGGYSDLWIPSAVELKRVGIKFKSRREYTSFLDIRFEHGVLQIPPLQVCGYTNILFRNLIAFEQLCPNVETPLTAYVVLMDCLIDTAHDARLLQLCGIIENRLNTDQAVADLFNKLKDQVPYTLETDYLLDVFDGINRFRRNKFRKWYASLKRDYCSNPWTLLSLIAAILLLILNMLQVIYAMLDYHRPT